MLLGLWFIRNQIRFHKLGRRLPISKREDLKALAQSERSLLMSIKAYEEMWRNTIKVL